MKTGENIYAGSEGIYEPLEKPLSEILKEAEDTGERLERDEAKKVGEKTITVVNQVGEKIGDYEESLRKATDRNGNPLYSKETIQRMVAEAAKTGAMTNPEVSREAKQIVEARDVEISPVGKELDAVGVEGFEITDAKIKIAKLEAALSLMDGDPVAQAGIQRRIEELRAQMNVQTEDLEDGFAETEGNVGSQGAMAVEYAEKLAENVGRIEGNEWMDPKERAQNDAAEAELAKQEELRAKMDALTAEVRNERGGEIVLTAEERQAAESRVQGKMGGGWLRKLKFGAQAVAVLAITTAITGLMAMKTDASSFTNAPVAQERSFDAMGMARGAAAQMMQRASETEGAERRNGPMSLDVWEGVSEAESAVEGLSEAKMLAKGKAIIDAEAIANRPGNHYYENGVFENMSEYNSDQKSSSNAYAESREWIYDLDDVGNRNGEVTNQIIIVCRDNPGVLASHTAFFPNVLKAAGISNEVINIKDPEARANAVYREMMGENGGDIQKKLLGGLLTVLQDEDTSFQYMLTNGVKRTFFEPRIDQNEDADAENLTLRTANKRRNNAKQVLITIRDKDENGQIVEYKLQLNLYCGFQPDMEALKTTKKTTKKISEIVTETVVPEEKTVEEENTVVVTETPTVVYRPGGGGGNGGGGGGSEERPGGNEEKPGGDEEKPGGNEERPGGNEEQPGGEEEQPGGDEEPGENPGGDEKPEEGPKEEPPKEDDKPKDDETPDEETVISKNPGDIQASYDAGQQVAGNREQGAIASDEKATEENLSIAGSDNKEQVIANADAEHKDADVKGQEVADANEKFESMTDAEFIDKVESYLSGGSSVGSETVASVENSDEGSSEANESGSVEESGGTEESDDGGNSDGGTAEDAGDNGGTGDAGDTGNTGDGAGDNGVESSN